MEGVCHTRKGYVNKTMKKRRILAFVGAIIIPLLYLISIILLVTENKYGMVFLVSTLAATFFLVPVIYLVIKFPKDMGEMYYNLYELTEDKTTGDESPAGKSKSSKHTKHSK